MKSWIQEKFCIDMSSIGLLYKKYVNLSLPAKAAIWFTICNFIQRGIQFLTMPIFTRMLSTEQYGVYTTFFSWVNLITVVSSMGIYGNAFNKAMVKFDYGERKYYVSSVQFLTTITTMIAAAAVLALYAAGIFGAELNSAGIVLMIVYLFGFPTMQYWYQMKRFEYQYKALVGVTLSISVLSVLIGIVAVQVTEVQGVALIASTVLVQSGIAFVLYFKIVNDGKCFYQKEFWGWSLRLALPLIPSALAEILLGHADRLMISNMKGLSYAAIYSTVYQISMVMAIIRTGINGAYVPWLYSSLKNNRTSNIYPVIRFIVVIFGSITVVAMLVGPELLRIVAPPSYYEALIDIPAVMLGCYFVSYYYILEQLEVYSEKVVFSSAVSVFGALLNILLNYLMIPKYGYLVAGYTTFISYAVMALFHSVYYVRLRRLNMIKNVIDLRFCFFSSVVMVIIGGGCLIMYRIQDIYRYLLLIIMLVCAFSQRKKIVAFFSTIKHRDEEDE